MKRELTIFYTDDDQEDLDFFREIIESIDADVDVTVHTQNNGHELLSALDNPPPTPHLVFLDINMPGLTGLEILKHVRNKLNNTTLPIVMFSTSNDSRIIEKSRELGATYYMTKSGVFDQLRQSIEHALKINWNTFIPNEKNFVYNVS